MTAQGDAAVSGDDSDKLAIDLCCGRKGFSRAFAEAGWEVVTVDIDPRFEPTICADILTLKGSRLWKATKMGNRKLYSKVVVVCSPDCARFSLAPRVWPKKGIRKALELVGACLELILDIEPDFWCMENPRARLRWFIGYANHSPELGNYGYRTAKATDLWGNIPFALLPAHRAKKKNNHHAGPWETWQSPTTGRDRKFDEVRDPSLRAEMPLGLSQAILEAVAAAASEQSAGAGAEA